MPDEGPIRSIKKPSIIGLCNSTRNYKHVLVLRVLIIIETVQLNCATLISRVC